jgi:hypothetical protein
VTTTRWPTCGSSCASSDADASPRLDVAVVGLRLLGGEGDGRALGVVGLREPAELTQTPGDVESSVRAVGLSHEGLEQGKGLGELLAVEQELRLGEALLGGGRGRSDGWSAAHGALRASLTWKERGERQESGADEAAGVSGESHAKAKAYAALREKCGAFEVRVLGAGRPT